MNYSILEERKKSIIFKNDNADLDCDKDSIAGSISQRACVYSGARVVLNPITDAYHIIHGPIGCAAYTWDIRGSLSSGSENYRNSFCTDLKEEEIIFGGETKLKNAIQEVVNRFNAKVIFVYSTCIAGIIGDDVESVCKDAEKKFGIRAIPVNSSGFLGTKSKGYKAACEAILKLMNNKVEKTKEPSVNVIGDFNLAGETWIIKSYLETVGLKVNSTLTGDSNCELIKSAPNAWLNAVQCAGSMTHLAKRMNEIYGIPFVKISFVGIDDTKDSLFKIADFFGDRDILLKTKKLIEIEERKIKDDIYHFRDKLKGKKAAIYVGGGFKAISLIKQFDELGMKTVLVGTQTGKKEEYEIIKSIAPDDAVILDDANPAELELFLTENSVDVLVGGVKERPLSYKLGIAFCDHNHERKHPLCGFVGAVNFAKEVYESIESPIWRIVKEI